MTVDELAPHGDVSVKFLMNDDLFYHAGDLIVPSWPDLGMDMRQGPSGLDRNQMKMMMMHRRGRRSNGRERRENERTRFRRVGEELAGVSNGKSMGIDC